MIKLYLHKLIFERKRYVSKWTGTIDLMWLIINGFDMSKTIYRSTDYNGDFFYQK